MTHVQCRPHLFILFKLHFPQKAATRAHRLEQRKQQREAKAAAKRAAIMRRNKGQDVDMSQFDDDEEVRAFFSNINGLSFVLDGFFFFRILLPYICARECVFMRAWWGFWSIFLLRATRCAACFNSIPITCVFV